MQSNIVDRPSIVHGGQTIAQRLATAPPIGMPAEAMPQGFTEDELRNLARNVVKLLRDETRLARERQGL